jgi:hypothetical protein
MQLIALASAKDKVGLPAGRNKGTRPVLNMVASSYSQLRFKSGFRRLQRLNFHLRLRAEDLDRVAPNIGQRIDLDLLGALLRNYCALNFY